MGRDFTEQMVKGKSLEYVLRRGVAEIIVEQELVRLLESGKRLRLKMGFDPSRADIHLGHVVGMRKLRQFQELGHQVVLIIGDWTAQIGDPTGASQTRPMLSAEEVGANAKTYMEQFFKVVDRDRTELRWQTEWYGEFDLAKVIWLTSKFTVAQLLAREDFAKRHAAGRPIAITELLYPLLQAYDSVAVEADVEFGGIDQKFNCLMGRELQQIVGQTAQHVFFMPLLVGIDGRQKMSKSLDNYISIEEPPADMYGKVMSIPDDIMMDYFELLTDVPDKELAEFRQQLSVVSVNPMIWKKRLAREIVGQFHGADGVGRGEEYFEKTVQGREEPDHMPRFLFSEDAHLRYSASSNTIVPRTVSPSELISSTGLASSRAEAKRLISQGAVKMNRRKLADDTPINLTDNDVFQVGKLRWSRAVDADKNPSGGD